MDVKKRHGLLRQRRAPSLHLIAVSRGGLHERRGWGGGQALTQLATHPVKLSIKVIVKARGKKKERKKKKMQSAADTPRLLIQEFHKSPGPVMRPSGPALRGSSSV